MGHRPDSLYASMIRVTVGAGTDEGESAMCYLPNGNKTLIVDEAPFTRYLLGVLVTKGGHEVIGVAADGREAFEQYKALRPDIVTLDWMMPSKSGEAVLKKIMQFHPYANAIMITGWADKVLEN